MAKISKEEIRKRLQQKKEKIEEKPKQKEEKKIKTQRSEKEAALIKDLKNLGIVTSIVIILLIASIIIQSQTDLFDRLAGSLFRLFYLS